MDFNQLKTFVEIAKCKSFSRAAENLHITQPSISAQVRSLETAMGHRLFERGGGRVNLTAAGRVFEPFAEECLSRLNHIQLTISELERSPRGSLTVSANDSTALYVLPAFFSRFKRQYPRVSLSINRAARVDTVEAVQKREMDFGIVSLPVKDPRLNVEIIHQDELVLTVPPNHPLIRDEPIELGELAKYPLLFPNQGRRRETLDELLASRKVTVRIAMEIDSSELMKRLIMAELGIGFLPRINLLEELRSGRLCEVPIHGVQLPRTLGLISHKERVLTRAGKVFYQVVTGNTAPNSGDNE